MAFKTQSHGKFWQLKTNNLTSFKLFSRNLHMFDPLTLNCVFGVFWWINTFFWNWNICKYNIRNHKSKHYFGKTRPFHSFSLGFLGFLPAADLLSEAGIMKPCLFWRLCFSHVCLLFVRVYLKVFWWRHRLSEHGKLTCRTSNFFACHGGSLSGHRYAQRDLLIGGC